MDETPEEGMLISYQPDGEGCEGHVTDYVNAIIVGVRPARTGSICDLLRVDGIDGYAFDCSIHFVANAGTYTAEIAYKAAKAAREYKAEMKRFCAEKEAKI